MKERKFRNKEKCKIKKFRKKCKNEGKTELKVKKFNN